MAWANLILYITAPDAERIRNWISNEETVAWIIQAARTGKTYTWRAVDQIDEVRPQEYSIWHKATGLTVPSGRPDVADADVLDPYQGWSQTLERADATGPWFGSGSPVHTRSGSTNVGHWRRILSDVRGSVGQEITTVALERPRIQKPSSGGSG